MTHAHATSLMVIAWIAPIHWKESQKLAAVIEGVGCSLALFTRRCIPTKQSSATSDGATV